MSGLPEDDDELLAELRRSVAGAARPEITDVLRQIPALVNPAEITGKTITDSTEALAGTRDAAAGRQLVVAFDEGTLAFEIDPEGVLTGQVPEPWTGRPLLLETLLGPLPVTVDEFGLFRHNLDSTGPFRLSSEAADGRVATDWLLP